MALDPETTYFPAYRHRNSPAVQFSREGWLARSKFRVGVLGKQIEPAYEGAWVTDAQWRTAQAIERERIK